jgi:hypothetical protein
MYYCHTHGLSINHEHTSMTCATRGPNHDATATADNMKGGCNLIRRRPQENVVWSPRSHSRAPAPTTTTA